MKVRFVSVTQPDEALIGAPGTLSAEDLIVYIARVSNPKNQENMATAPKLVRFLIDHKHWSPFEMINMTVEIQTSRAIAQQILRHRSFSYQEFSQRYSRVSAMEDVQLRYQAKHNRQSSTTELTEEDAIIAEKLVMEALETAQRVYDQLLDMDVAKECARMVMPLTTQTTLYMNGTLRSWIHYLMIRCDAHVQLEHREIAEHVREIFIDKFPNISEALQLGE